MSVGREANRGARRKGLGVVDGSWATLGLLLLLGCSPDSAPVTSEPLLVVGSKGRAPGRLYLPRALAVDRNTGCMYVADRTGRLLQFDGTGRPVREWRLPQSEYGQPVGLCLESGGSLLVNDSHYHRILRYSPDGARLLASWGTEGTGPGQFTFGRDVVVDSAGFIYAGDYGGLNDRIQKFTREGAFVLEWGGQGEEPGKFRRPQGMAVERRGSEETILVADCANHRVQRFSLDGRWIASFGSLGLGAGQLRYPYSVAAADDGSILVCEWGNHRIQRFDAAGRSLGFWGTAGSAPGELAHPWDVALGPGDTIYVADCENHRIQVLRGSDFGPVAVPVATAGATALPGGSGWTASPGVEPGPAGDGGGGGS